MTTLHQLRRRLATLQEAATPRTPPLTANEAADCARIDQLMSERPELTLKEAFMINFEREY